MKLTPEEIRKEARKIADNWTVSVETQESRILALVEKATGQKLLEPFDRANVKHGAIWETDCNRFLLVAPNVVRHCRNELFVLSLWENHPGGLLEGMLTLTKADQIADHLRNCGFKYAGQYNFAAGLPKQ